MDDDSDMVNNSQSSKNNVSKLMVDLNKRELEKFFNLDKKTKTAIAISTLALLLFVGVGFLSPFKDKLFSQLYQKPPSKAAESQNVWKAYSSSKYNYLFKYPGQFNLEPGKDESVSLISRDSKIAQDGQISEGIKLTVSVLTDKKHIDEQMNLPETLQKSPKTTYGNEDKALLPPSFSLPAGSSYNALRLYNKLNMMESVVNIFSEKDGKKFAIHFSCINPSKLGECESLLPQLLSTFKLAN